MTSLTLLSKQVHPEFYSALGLPTTNKFYIDCINGTEFYFKHIDMYFAGFRDKIDDLLKDANYLNYSENARVEIEELLKIQRENVENYKNGQMQLSDLKEKLHCNNLKVAHIRN